MQLSIWKSEVDNSFHFKEEKKSHWTKSVGGSTKSQMHEWRVHHSVYIKHDAEEWGQIYVNCLQTNFRKEGETFTKRQGY